MCFSYLFFRLAALFKLSKATVFVINLYKKLSEKRLFQKSWSMVQNEANNGEFCKLLIISALLKYQFFVTPKNCFLPCPCVQKALPCHLYRVGFTLKRHRFYGVMPMPSRRNAEKACPKSCFFITVHIFRSLFHHLRKVLFLINNLYILGNCAQLVYTDNLHACHIRRCCTCCMSCTCCFFIS